MKKNLLFALCFSVFLQGCSSFVDDTFKPLVVEQTNFPKESENFGKAVSKEIRETIQNLNEMGVDYTNADNSLEFKTQFYKDIRMASPTLIKTKSSNDQIQITPEVFAEKFSNLTAIQIEFVSRIIEECGNSTSKKDLAKIIFNLNEEIYSSVPKIEQERLFNVTAVLYYGLNEIHSLKKQGQMLQTPHSNLQAPRLKSGNEDGEGWGDVCRKFLATGWTIAIGEPTPTGEIVMAIATVIVGGVLLYEIVTCSSTTEDPDQSYCQTQYEACYSPYLNGCSTCLGFCLTQGYWPPYSTHKCT